MNVPNILTILRMFMVPLFLFCFFSGMENKMAISFTIVLLAGVTDFLDGYIARRYKLITKFGIAMDPLADKMMLVAVLLSLTVKQVLPPWILIVVAVKECTLILGALLLHRHHEIVIPANRIGKAATITFYVAVLAIALKTSFYMIFMLLFVVLTMFAFTTYLRNFRSIRREMKGTVNKKD